MMQLPGAKTILILFIQLSVLLCSCLGVMAQSPSMTAPQTGPDFTKEHQLLQQGKYNKAIARELGIAYYKKSDYVQAAHSLQHALQEDPQDNEATQLLGLSYYLSGK